MGMGGRISAYIYDTMWLLLRPSLGLEIVILAIVLIGEIFAMPGVAIMTIPSETPLRDTWREALTYNPDVKEYIRSSLISLHTERFQVLLAQIFTTHDS